MKNYILPFMIVVSVVLSSCSVPTDGAGEAGYPDFITTNEDYYVTRIGKIPKIDPKTYRLEVTGLVDTPLSLPLDELYAMDLVEFPLTVECIGNSPSGPLLSTAVWRGVFLIDILETAGISPEATGVVYRAADGYFASHTLEQVRDNGVLAALYMNGEPIPEKHGFPIRILNPGYYGVKQPAWVTEIEVVDTPIKDYWEERGWDCSPPIAVDSTIFFPEDGAEVSTGKPVPIGGAAFGGTRVEKVEVSIDEGETWTEATITESIDADNVWIFWEAELVFSEPGRYTINARATDIRGNSQIDDDPNRYDGASDWPMIRIKAEKPL